jgi:hypothetical protein
MGVKEQRRRRDPNRTTLIRIANPTVSAVVIFFTLVLGVKREAQFGELERTITHTAENVRAWFVGAKPVRKTAAIR